MTGPTGDPGGASSPEGEPHYVDLDTARYLAGERPRWEGLSVDAARALSKSWMLGHQGYEPSGAGARAAVTADEVDLKVPGGAVPVRIYRRSHAPARAPLLVFFHGGGWVIGDLDTHDELCRELAHRVDAVVASVAYRLAPEHRYPVAVEDCIAALGWLASHAERLGVDPGRIAVAGDSAGGNLATVVARHSRDGGGPPLVAQVLVYPVVDNTDALAASSSAKRFGTGFELTLEGFQWFQDQYFGPGRGRRSEPDASPLLASDLRHLPRSLLVVADLDPIADSIVEYAGRLAGAGVPTRLVRFDGVMHAFVTMGAVFSQAFSAVDTIVEELSDAFADSRPARDR